MDRKDFFNRQRVLQSEMDAAFTGAETSDWNLRLDSNIVGVIKGLVPTLSGASSVQITSGIAIDQLGKRVKAFYDGSGSKIQSYTTDTAGSATSVTGGNERWIAIYARYGRNALDSRVDGTGATVYFDQPECLHDNTVGVLATAGLGGAGVDKFFIEMGASAATGTAVRPTLRTDSVLICDIKRTPADASNVLDTTRRMIFSISDSTAIGTGNGVGITMSDFTAWLGGRTNLKQTTLHAQLDKIFTDLAATTASDDGAERIGAQANGNLSSGSVRSQLDSLDTNKGGLSLANVWSAINTFSTQMKITPTQNTSAIQYATAVASDTRLMLFDFSYNRASQSDTKLRVYLNNKPMFTNGPQRSLLITVNASWNGTNWVADVNTASTVLSECYAIELGGYRHVNGSVAAMTAGPVFYRFNSAGAATFTDASFAMVCDMGRVRTAVQGGSGVGVSWADEPWNQSPSGAGLGNFYNIHSGEFISSGSMRVYEWDFTLQATGAFTAVMSFPYGISYSSVPSTITVTAGTLTNCGTPTLSVSSSIFKVSTAVTGAGLFRCSGNALVRA